jgi:hypothetical protein
VEKGGGRSSSSDAIERRTVKRGSGWRPTAFQAPWWHRAARGKRRAVESMGWLARALDRQARAVTLSHNRGERRGATDAVRAQLIGEPETSQGPSVSGGVREGEG